MLAASQEQIHRACERAARYRRDIALEAGERPGTLDKRIASAPLPTLKSSGIPNWFTVGSVVDSVVGRQLSVHWNPETDEVKVEQPDDVGETAESSAPEPSPFQYSVLAKRYEVDETYRYFLNGKEYAPRSAKRLVNKNRSLDGWTWERRDS
jgi:hypothetical protein